MVANFNKLLGEALKNFGKPKISVGTDTGKKQKLHINLKKKKK